MFCDSCTPPGSSVMYQCNYYSHFTDVETEAQGWLRNLPEVSEPGEGRARAPAKLASTGTRIPSPSSQHGQAGSLAKGTAKARPPLAISLLFSHVAARLPPPPLEPLILQVVPPTWTALAGERSNSCSEGDRRLSGPGTTCRASAAGSERRARPMAGGTARPACGRSRSPPHSPTESVCRCGR